ncbi:glycosyltransferase, partial [uncultured Mameliella sp.]|uniref:glycosyltransferase n=1 Tax=uncultured Mameliella sp. TaxID=1447087 RepID=UPI002602F79B
MKARAAGRRLQTECRAAVQNGPLFSTPDPLLSPPGILKRGILVPKISVVTAVFNRARTLGEALDSVAVQTHPDVEHVIQDGGSTDGTLELIEARTQSN